MRFWAPNAAAKHAKHPRTLHDEISKHPRTLHEEIQGCLLKIFRHTGPKWAFGHRTRAEMREPPPERFHHEIFRAARPRPRPRPQVTLTVSRLTATGIAASRPDRDHPCLHRHRRVGGGNHINFTSISHQYVGTKCRPKCQISHISISCVYAVVVVAAWEQVGLDSNLESGV